MTLWPAVQLADLVFFQEGPGLRNWQWTDTGMKVINGKNILESGVIDTSNTERFISSEEFESRYRHFAIDAGDIVVSSSGTLGKVAIVSERHLPLMMNTSVIRFRTLDAEVLDSDFLFAFLRSPEFQDQARAFATGAAQMNFGPSHVKQMIVRLPPVSVQRTIGRVLHLLDVAIENNRRRVEVLEGMARAIYREWFVRFRFPGHENVELVDSDLGHIPTGWELKTVRELSSTVTRGIAPKYADDGGWIVLNQKCIRDERVSLGPSRRQSKHVADDKAVRYGDVLINSTGVGTLGRVAMYRGAAERLTVDSHVTIARPTDGHLNPWFGLSLVAMKADFERLGSGSTGQTELSRADIGSQRLPVPPSELLARFSGTVWPSLSEADALIAECEPLGQMRDVLLPKLVTGQIDVSPLELDALVEGAVA